jgi:hypothetical protein
MKNFDWDAFLGGVAQTGLNPIAERMARQNQMQAEAQRQKDLLAYRTGIEKQGKEEQGQALLNVAKQLNPDFNFEGVPLSQVPEVMPLIERGSREKTEKDAQKQKADLQYSINQAKSRFYQKKSTPEDTEFLYQHAPDVFEMGYKEDKALEKDKRKLASDLEIYEKKNKISTESQKGLIDYRYKVNPPKGKGGGGDKPAKPIKIGGQPAEPTQTKTNKYDKMLEKWNTKPQF